LDSGSLSADSARNRTHFWKLNKASTSKPKMENEQMLWQILILHLTLIFSTDNAFWFRLENQIYAGDILFWRRYFPP
jgi:hypothetical protein